MLKDQLIEDLAIDAGPQDNADLTISKLFTLSIPSDHTKLLVLTESKTVRSNSPLDVKPLPH